MRGFTAFGGRYVFHCKFSVRVLISSTPALQQENMLGSYNIENKENSRTIPSKKKTFTVAVEGNIGSGKSTFIEHYKDYPEVKVIPEPVALWKDINGFNILDMMYKDASRWSLAFQSYAQLTMMSIHKATPKGCRVKMMERSLFSGRYCFVENLYHSGLMAEIDYAILSEWFDWIVSNEKPDIDLIVYLRASPQTCQDRINKRNRQEEKEVPLDYLQSLHDLHENWLNGQSRFKVNAPVLVLDADHELCVMEKKFEECKDQILCGVL